MNLKFSREVSRKEETIFFFKFRIFFVIINDIELGSQVKFGRRHSATTAPVGLPGLPGFFLSDWNVIISNDYKTEPQTKIRTVVYIQRSKGSSDEDFCTSTRKSHTRARCMHAHAGDIILTRSGVTIILSIASHSGLFFRLKKPKGKILS